MSDDAAVAHQGPRAACQPCRDFHAGKSDIQAEVKRLKGERHAAREAAISLSADLALLRAAVLDLADDYDNDHRTPERLIAALRELGGA